ncbi:MAG TPA: hypothetical protein VFX54_06730, partial [Candidatus Binatia bacterium]|nr:hypothetical protein [Candidatus Binatia bacterium]
TPLLLYITVRFLFSIAAFITGQGFVNNYPITMYNNDEGAFCVFSLIEATRAVRCLTGVLLIDLSKFNFIFAALLRTRWPKPIAS